MSLAQIWDENESSLQAEPFLGKDSDLLEVSSVSTRCQGVRITSSQSVTSVRSPDSLLFLQPQNLFLFYLSGISPKQKNTMSP